MRKYSCGYIYTRIYGSTKIHVKFLSISGWHLSNYVMDNLSNGKIKIDFFRYCRWVCIWYWLSSIRGQKSTIQQQTNTVDLRFICHCKCSSVLLQLLSGQRPSQIWCTISKTSLLTWRKIHSVRFRGLKLRQSWKKEIYVCTCTVWLQIQTAKSPAGDDRLRCTIHGLFGLEAS